MFDLFAGVALALVGSVAVMALQSRFQGQERRLIWLAYWANVGAAFAMLLITEFYYGGGDLLNYRRGGLQIAELLRQDFGTWFPEVIGLYFQQEYTLFANRYMAGSSTGSMFAASGLLLFFFLDSFYAACVFIGILSFSGQLAIYVGLRDYFTGAYHRRLLIATLLIPSVVYWSAGVLKESVAVAGMGWIFLAVIRFVYKRFRFSHLVLLVAGIVLTMFTKAYIIIALVVGTGALYYWHRSRSTPGESALVAKPIYLVLALAVAVGGFVVIGELFPRFALENVAEEAGSLQGTAVEGGSDFDIGDAEERSLAGQLTFAPMALVTALFRPFIFEAHNVMAAINALETTIILVVFIKIIRARPIKTTLRMIMSSPALMFCLAFVCVFGVGVGLTTTNAGTLSRYRMPMMPFYAALLLALLPIKTTRRRRR